MESSTVPDPLTTSEAEGKGPSDHRTPVSACPACGHRVDGALNLKGGEAPKPGDITVCIRCARVSSFSSDLTLVAMTDAELDELPKETFAELLKVVITIKGLHDAGVRR